MHAWIFALLVSLWSLGANAPQQPRNVPGGNADDGQRAFEDHGCYQCHGYAAHGGAGARLAPDPIPFESFSQYVRRPTGQMPPYTPKVLSEGELADIYAFLESIPDPPLVDSIPALNLD